MYSAPQHSPKDDWVCTEARVDQIKYEWRIKNFKYLPEVNGNYKLSPTFPMNNDRRIWTLSFYPRGANLDSIGYVSVYLNLYNADKFGMRVKAEFSIIQSNTVKGKITMNQQYSAKESWGYAKFVEKSKLLSNDSSDDTVTICCKLNIFENVINTSATSRVRKLPVSFYSEKSHFKDGFRLLYGDEKFSDCTILAVKKKFSSHKAILASRSPVLSLMFENMKNDPNGNSVKIQDIEADVVKAMLEYIYTDDVTNIREMAKKLLKAAEIYQIDGLKSFCEEALFANLNENNACEILSISDLHHASQLKQYVLEYIVDHRCEVVTSEGFKSTSMSPALYQELIRAISLPKNTDINKKSDVLLIPTTNSHFQGFPY